ncbi:MAG: hypothetical protein ABFC96_11945 [Thermoguttaceae bacterium]
MDRLLNDSISPQYKGTKANDAMRANDLHIKAAHCLAFLTLCATLTSSCNSPPSSTEPGNLQPTPQAARDAIVALIRQKPKLFIGEPNPERLANCSLIHLDADRWRFGRFDVDLKTLTYLAIIGEEGPEPYLYEGKFTWEAGRLTAKLPRTSRFHRQTATSLDEQ